MSQTIYNALKSAKRPILIVGAGVRLSGASEAILELSKRLNVPVAPTWAALDMFPESVGSFGTHGTRSGNFAVQNSDFILSIGSRLDSKATGTPVESFAPHAKIYMIDVDKYEIGKFKDRVIGVCQDAKEFINEALKWKPLDPKYTWVERIKGWKAKYPVGGEYPYDLSGVNPYEFIKELSSQASEGEIICTDTGCAVAWVSQAWNWKKGQRFLHAFNQTPMGYGLPAALGAYYATNRRIILITGDGSLMMSLGELATAKGLPIKIFMFNNKGHAMCRQTQREWLGGIYPSTSIEGGLKFPDFVNVARACGIPGWYIDDREKKHSGPFDSNKTVIEKTLGTIGPTFVQVDIPEDAEVVPKVKYGRPNEDGDPLLSREELKEQMCVS